MRPPLHPQAGAGSGAGLTSQTTRTEAQRHLAACFIEAGLASPQLDARLLLCASLSIDHAALVRDPDLPLGAAVTRLAHFATRRLAGEPVSRILGRREFWGLSFQIDAAVLDPRADTEILVETVLEALGARRTAPLAIVDLGTGSGAILCALLSECHLAFGIGVDRSFAACRIARENVLALGLSGRATIVQGDWTAALRGPLDVVVSNPPYIARADLATLDRDVRCFDPPEALDGGPDGLAPYRAIIPALPDLLRPDGIAAFEGGWRQSASIAAMMRESGLASVAIARDLAGHDRVVSGKNRR